MQRRMRSPGGFTLVELLIVIALLGALVAIMLPNLRANRVKAMEATCDYNQAVTIKTLNDNFLLNGTLPDKMHTGTTAPVAAGYTLMDGMPGDVGEAGTTLNNMTLANGRVTVQALSQEMVDSLEAAGIETLVSGADSETAASTSANIVRLGTGTNGFLADDGEPITFNARDVSEWEGDSSDVGGADGVVTVLFVAPTCDWSKTTDQSWGSITESSVGAFKVGECKVPVDADFSYYMAYIKVFTEDKAGLTSADADYEPVPARLIGTSCPECGVTNP